MAHEPQYDRDQTQLDPDRPASLLAFVGRFPNDEACAGYLFHLRWPNGFVCPTCGVERGHPIASRPGVFACPVGHQTSLTAGTVMHRTKQPLRLWFYGAYLVSTLTPGISALQFQKQLGIGRYETAFQMLHKLRSVMVVPDREPLHTLVEVDEAFVGGVDRAGGRGRGTNKALVVLAVEVVHWTARDPLFPDDPDSGVGKVRAGRIRAAVIRNAKAETLLPWVADNVQRGSVVFTDGWAGYNGLKALGFEHHPVLQSHEGKPTGRYLPMVHLIISNLKRWLLGTHKGAVSPKHLQAYLNEFVFRFNRRFWRGPAFVRALGLSLSVDTRPEYETLYSGEWTHPNPRPEVDETELGRRVEAIWQDVLSRAPDERMRAWIKGREVTVRAAISARIQAEKHLTVAETKRMFQEEVEVFVRMFPRVRGVRLSFRREHYLPRAETTDRDLAWYDWESRTLCLLYRALTRGPDTVRGLIRHELGHAADPRVEEDQGAETRADDFAQRATGQPVRYTKDGVQNAVRGVPERPDWLPK